MTAFLRSIDGAFAILAEAVTGLVYIATARIQAKDLCCLADAMGARSAMPRC